MTFTLPDLPYALDALAPSISQETLEFHYGKHHQTYVNNLNNLIKDTEHAHATLEEIITSSSGGIYNNAAQVWNHSFYWYTKRLIIFGFNHRSIVSLLNMGSNNRWLWFM